MSKGRHSGPDLDAVEHEAIAWAQKLTPGEATREDVAALKRWRAQSPAHDAAFVEARRVWVTVGAAGRALHPKEDFLAELDFLGERRRTMNRRVLLGGGVATLAAATIYGAVNPPLGLWPSVTELKADYRTGTGEQRKVTFAGDVTINLNTQTSLAVRSTEGSEDRIELIAGEASFAAPRRVSRSLVVLAADGKTIADAGRFDIRYAAGGQGPVVSVTCFDGTVRIEHRADTSALRAGQQVRYDAVELSQIASVDPMAASEWQRGIVEFRSTPLIEAVEEINRYRPGRIILMNAALGRKQLSGRFRIDQMNQVLLQLEHAFNAKLQRLPGGIVLLS